MSIINDINEVFFADGTRRKPIKYKKKEIPYEEKKKGYRLYNGLIFDYYLHGGDLNAPSCTVIRKKVFDEVGEYNEELSSGQDKEMFLLISNRFRIGVVKKITVKYLAHPGAISETISRFDYYSNLSKIYHNVKIKCKLDKKQEQFIDKKMEESKKILSNL